MKNHIYVVILACFFIVDYNLILKIVITCFMCSMYINFDQVIQKIFCFFKVFANSSTWTDILYQLKLDARQFLVSYKDKCLECVLTDKKLDEVNLIKINN